MHAIPCLSFTVWYTAGLLSTTEVMETALLGERPLMKEADCGPSCVDENVFLDWAKIVDCGDAPLTFLVRYLISGEIERMLTVLGRTIRWH
jgi:hypothetical protein